MDQSINESLCATNFVFLQLQHLNSEKYSKTKNGFYSFSYDYDFKQKILHPQIQSPIKS